MANTVRIQRIFRAPPERVYRAILDPQAIVKWNPPNGFTAKVESLDARVGGTFKMSFTNFSTGATHTFGGTYEELVPGERIVASDAFDNPGLPGQIRTTYTLRETSFGTELTVVQEGLPDVIPPEACLLGWQESLALLALIVEPEIPG